MFAYGPTEGYRDERDAVELPWEHWEREAESRGTGIADMFAEPPADRPDAEA